VTSIVEQVGSVPAGTEHEADFVLLADIFPTGYHGCELAEVSPGESVAVYGGGPVGLMAAYSALLRGASMVLVVDRVPERLQKAQDIGAIPINFQQADAVEQIKQHTNGEGTDKGVDAVGYQAQTSTGDREEPAVVLNSLIQSVRATGRLGVPGLYVPADPGAPDEAAKQGMLLVAIGKLFEKGLRIGTGQCNVKRSSRPWHGRTPSAGARPRPGPSRTNGGRQPGSWGLGGSIAVAVRRHGLEDLLHGSSRGRGGRRCRLGRGGAGRLRAERWRSAWRSHWRRRPAARARRTTSGWDSNPRPRDSERHGTGNTGRLQTARLSDPSYSSRVLPTVRRSFMARSMARPANSWSSAGTAGFRRRARRSGIRP
jgi:hypothetical protein